MSENQKSSEKLTADALASEKIHELFGEDFNMFGVRFMNSGEYKELLAGRPGGSAFGEVSHVNGVPFSKALRRWTEECDWHDVMDDFTDFRTSTLKAEGYRVLLSTLREARGIGKVRDKTLGQLQNLLVDRTRNLEYHRYIGGGLDLPLFSLLQYAVEGVLKNVKSMGKHKITEEDKDLIEHFLSDPSTLSKGELRALFTLLSEKTAHQYQYEIAAIFHPSAYRKSRGVSEDWPWWELTSSAQNGLMAAIVTIPDKKLMKDVIESASGNPELAHPVFDSLGNIRYPK